MAWHKTSRHARGYGTKWDKLRKQILARDKHLCQICRNEGRVKAANHVDHIKPKAKGGTDDPSNLQSLCAACHDRKTATDNGAKPKVQFGLDGWPITPRGG